MVNDRFADGLTSVSALAELFTEFGSLALEVALATFVVDPIDCGVTVIWTLALALFASVPSEHVTVPAPCEQLPCEGVAELKVTPGEGVTHGH